MYLKRFLPNFAVLPKFRGSATVQNIRSPALTIFLLITVSGKYFKFVFEEL